MFINSRERGVTLVELIIAIVIISIGVIGILGVISTSTSSSADPLRRKQAMMIAESLMEEVQLAHFTFCDPADPNSDTAASTADCTIPENWGAEPGNSRPFDNVNDYVSAPGVASAVFMSGASITDATGNAFNVAGYTASLMVTPAAVGGVGAAGAAADTAVLRITVTVNYGGDSIVLDGYKARYAPNY